MSENPPKSPKSKKRRKPSFRVQPKGRSDKFVRLRAISCFKEFHQRVCAGWSVSALVDYVQDTNGELEDLTPDYVYDLIRSYRNSLPPSEFVVETAVSNQTNKAARDAAKAMDEGLNELEELERLYYRQLDRIEIDTRAEKAAKKLFPSMTQEIRMAKDILTSRAELKMDLGLSKRHLGELQMGVDQKLITDVGAKYGTENVEKVLNDPLARRKVMSIAERFLLLPEEAGKELDIEGAEQAEAEPTDVVETAEAPEVSND